ncbi:MAG: hypothetical protein OXD31_12380 [Chloroflexi bacterium]|nr:hypothetical protein [Chloroflexota bacterium]
MVNSLIILAIVVLPGWISVSANQRYYPRIVDKSTVMAWGLLFYHAVTVHVIGFAIFSCIGLIFQNYFLNTLHVDQILTDGPAEFTKNSPGTALAIFGIYSVWMIIGSTLSGVIDLPSRLTIGVGWTANKMRLAPEPTGDEPVWYSALNLDRRRDEKELNILISVRMKNGDIYRGALHTYPILPDSEASKDVRLGNSVLYPNGNTDSPIELEFSDYEGGGVLLNTTNVSSIEYILHDDYGDADASKTA